MAEGLIVEGVNDSIVFQRVHDEEDGTYYLIGVIPNQGKTDEFYPLGEIYGLQEFLVVADVLINQRKSR